jgi:thymidylate synthase (FAD)
MGDVRLITEPVVELVGRPAVDADAVGRYFGAIGVPIDTDIGDIHGPGDGQSLIELGARSCYQSFGKGRPHSDHVRHLQEVGHFSCDEHAQYSFLIAGISRSLSHELVRHRHLSPSQLSQRYCDQAAHNLGFVVPPAMLPMLRDWETGKTDLDALTDGELSAAATFDSWRRACVSAMQTYSELVADLSESMMPAGLTDGAFTEQYIRVERSRVRKLAHAAARSVLPECCETRMMLSGNLRAWRDMIGKRCQPEAEAEIRRLCCRIFDQLAAEAPDVFADLRRVPLSDGTFALERGGKA